jgi:hypothetical protein
MEFVFQMGHRDEFIHPAPMNSRWYNAAVIVAWLASMGWLVKTKVLPPLLVGEPPSYRQVIEAQNHDPPAGWRVSWKGNPLGWALTDTKSQSNGLTEVHGRVHFDTFPIGSVTPIWLQPFLGLAKKPLDQLSLDATSTMLIDTFGRLLRFDSAVELAPLLDEVTMRGTVEGGQLQLVVRSGNQSFSHELSLPPKALLADALSPQTRLPGLHIGQTWSVPVFNPIWPTKSPIEIISAKVEESDTILWDGEPQRTLVVVYRHESGTAGKADQKNVQGRLWVRDDGVVLRQEAMLFDSSIVFVRLTGEEAAKLLEKAGARWWIFGHGRMGKRR